MSRLFTRWWEWNVFHITSNNVQVFECCYHYFCEHTDILKSVLSSLFLMKPYLCCYFTEAVCLWSNSDVWPFLTLNRVWWEDSATMWGQGMMFILLHSGGRESGSLGLGGLTPHKCFHCNKSQSWVWDKEAKCMCLELLLTLSRLGLWVDCRTGLIVLVTAIFPSLPCDSGKPFTTGSRVFV